MKKTMFEAKSITKMVEKLTGHNESSDLSSSSLLETSYNSIKEAFEKLSNKDFVVYLDQLALPLLRKEPIFNHLVQTKFELRFNDPLNKAISIDYQTDVTNSNNETFILHVYLVYQISQKLVYLASYINDKKTGQRNTLVKGQTVPDDKPVSSVQSMITKQAKKMTEKYDKLMAMTVRKYYW
jgi:hypothetical protein